MPPRSASVTRGRKGLKTEPALCRRSERLLPLREAHSAAGTRLRAVAGHVVHQLHLEAVVRYSAGQNDPVADLGSPGHEADVRQLGQLALILALESADDVVVDVLFDDDVAQASGGD